MSLRHCMNAAPGSTLVPGCVTGLSREALDEGEGHVSHAAATVVGDEGVATIGKLDDLGHALVALMLLVSSLGNRAGDGVVLGALDDQERPTLGVLGVV